MVSLELLAVVLRRFIGQPVSIAIADSPTGWAFARITATMSAVHVDDEELGIVLDGGAHMIVVYADMIDGTEVGDGYLRLAYHAGDIEITTC